MKFPLGDVLKDVEKTVVNTENSGVENGGHYMHGDKNATLWDPGPPAELLNIDGNTYARAQIHLLRVNGENARPKKMGMVAYWWHVHPKLIFRTPLGGKIRLGSSEPSRADYNVQSGYENFAGYKKTTFVIGVRDKKVTFCNGQKTLIRIKYSEFIRMGERR